MIILAFITNLMNPTDLAIVSVVALVLFHRRLPSLGRDIAGLFSGFKKGLGEDHSTSRDDEINRPRLRDRDDEV